METKGSHLMVVCEACQGYRIAASVCRWRTELLPLERSDHTVSSHVYFSTSEVFLTGWLKYGSPQLQAIETRVLTLIGAAPVLRDWQWVRNILFNVQLFEMSSNCMPEPLQRVSHYLDLLRRSEIGFDAKAGQELERKVDCNAGMFLAKYPEFREPMFACIQHFPEFYRQCCNLPPDKISRALPMIDQVLTGELPARA